MGTGVGWDRGWTRDTPTRPVLGELVRRRVVSDRRLGAGDGELWEEERFTTHGLQGVLRRQAAETVKDVILVRLVGTRGRVSPLGTYQGSTGL